MAELCELPEPCEAVTEAGTPKGRESISGLIAGQVSLQSIRNRVLTRKVALRRAREGTRQAAPGIATARPGQPDALGPYKRRTSPSSP